MPTAQGDLALLNDPVAQKLLQAALPAHLAYTWPDGTPRVVPIWFHWNGQQIILGGPPGAPKMKALTSGTSVAITISTNEFPYKVLYIRGSVSLGHSDDVVPEYILMARRMLGEEGGAAWLAQITPLLPVMGGMARLAVTPQWASIVDFEQRFPSAVTRAIATATAAAGAATA
jgi:hypothetical protein